MKVLVASCLLLCVGCSQQKPAVSIPGREVFDEFQAIMVAGDFEKLAGRLDPEVLQEFRRRLEFTTGRPLDGSWFTGTRERSPTKEELSRISDSQFFTLYMKGSAAVIGNPLAERYAGGNLVTATSGSMGYRHFVFTKDDKYAFPTTFSFKQSGDVWHLVEPSVVTKLAGQLRAASGKTLDE